jgi:hypothetical protein
MATVRFSDELKGDIRRNAERLFDKKLESAKQNYPSNWGRTVYDLAFQTHRVAIQSLPIHYFTTDKDIDMSGFQGEGWDRDMNCRVNLDLGSELPFTNSMEAELHGFAERGSRYGGWVLNPEDKRWDTFKAEYLTYCQGIHKVTAEKKVFVDGVQRITEAYTTLAPALKAWPALWDLVPEHKQHKHKEIVERKKKEVVVEGVNLDDMTAVSAMAKLTGGS